jgi:protein ImuB
MEFDGEVDALETLWRALKQLIAQVVSDLASRGCGARRIQIDFMRMLAPPVQKTVLLSRPSRDPAILFNLSRCAMETVESDAGFIGVRLSVPVFERVADEQIGLLRQDEQRAEADVVHLIERLRVRLGDGAVLSARLVESHLPERTFGFVEATGPGAAKVAATDQTTTRKARPLHLLPEPKEIRCMVVPVFSIDGDGTPVSIAFDGIACPLTLARGPERIAGVWWHGRNKTRDYFDVEAENGQRFWIFRVLETGKWYLHGIFDC